MINEYVKLIVKNLRHRKLRSYLTMIGIIIGVTALISLITLGDGLQKGMTDQFDNFGLRRVFVAGKNAATFGPPSGESRLTENDIQTLEKLPFLELVTYMYQDTAEVEYKRETKIHSIFSVNLKDIDKFFRDVGRGLDDGRFLQEGDSKVAIIGYGTAKDMFDNEIPLKASININDEKFRVVGILEETGEQQGDFSIYVPVEDFRKLKNNPEAISAITAQVVKGYDVELAAQKIERALERERNDENFEVTNPQKIKEQTEGILGVVTWVVVGIAFISLLVGAVGIMNSMYTSVLERTREIGIMKAIGAQNKDVLSMFLIEAGSMGLVGGSIGIFLGLLISFGAAAIINTAGIVQINLDISINLILFGIIFSFGVGVISGMLPALRASYLKPVEALRYE